MRRYFVVIFLSITYLYVDFLAISHIFMTEKDIIQTVNWNRLGKGFIRANLTRSSKDWTKNMLVPHYSNNPLRNHLTENFLLTGREKKVGHKILFVLINFKPNWQLQVSLTPKVQIWNKVEIYYSLLYIQLSFSVYLTCKWKGAVSYDTLPGTGFTGSGTIFSLVTTAGKFNRERRFWSLYEDFQILRQICYSVLLARHCVRFIAAGQRNRYDFLCLIRLSSIQNHGPRSSLVRKSWVKWSFSHWFSLRK